MQKITLKKKIYVIGIIFFITSLLLIDNTNKDLNIKENEVGMKDSYIDIEEYLLEIDSYVKEYSKYFNFDENKIIDLTRSVTNNYSSSFKLKIYGKEYSFETPKETSLMLVYNIYRSPKTYKIEKNEYIKSKRIIKSTYKDNKIIINEEYTFSEYIGYISDLFSIDKTMALAISNYETGYQKSSLAKNKNNFGGLRSSSGYLSYPTPQAGVICFVSNLKRIIYKNNITNLNDLSGIYVNGKKNKPSTSWVNNITLIQNKIKDKEEKYFK